jgi:hypothetical protein
LLDLRTILPEEDDLVSDALEGILAGPAEGAR